MTIESATSHLGKQKIGARSSPQNVITDAQGKQKVDAIAFPPDLGKHQFLMQFVKYEFDPEKAASADTMLSVAFPIPTSGMTDKNELRYNSTDLGVLGGAVAGIAGEIKDAFEQSGNAPSAGEGQNPDVKTLVDNALKAGAAGGRSALPGAAGNALTVALGNTVNPQVALLFEGVNLKEFTFTWRFAPDTLEDSILLKKIITEIKKQIYPKFTSTENNLYLAYPSQVDLFYLGSADHLHYFKRASVKNFEVNYAPDGPMFMEQQGAPGIIDCTMSFQESEIWTSEDF